MVSALNLAHESRKAGCSVRSKHASPEDLRDLLVILKNVLLKHNLAVVVDDVAVLVNQVALDVHQTAFLISELPARVLLQHGGAVRVRVKVTLNALDVELREWENLRELSVLQVSALPDLALVNVDDVALFVDEVALFVDGAAEVVEELSGAVVLGDDVSVLVLVELAHHVLNVKALAVVVKQLVQVVVVQLALVELLAALLVHDVALAWQHVPAVLVNTACFLVDVEALARLHEDGFAVRVVEVAHNLVGVEVEFLNAERRWNFTTLVHFVAAEHWLASHVFDDVLSLGVSQVTTLVDWLSLFVVLATILVLKNNNVTFVVSIEVSEDVVLVESAQVCIWWDGDRNFLLGLEVLHHILVDVHNV